MITGSRFTYNRRASKISVLLQLGVCWLVLLAASGCRCPWHGINTDLAQSTHWLQGGMDALSDGHHTQAEELLHRAVSVRPNDPVLREHLADALLQQGKTDQAIGHLTRAIELSGPDARLYVKLGSLYLENGQWIPAARFAEIALQTNRQLPSAWALKGDTNSAKGRLTDALADYQHALSFGHSIPEVHLKVAEIHRIQGRPLRAFSTVEQMLTRLPYGQHSEAGLLMAGQLLTQIGQPAQAIEKLQIATAHPDASAQCFMHLADAQLALRQPSQARLTLVKAQGLHPNSPAIAQRLNELQEDNQKIASLSRPDDEVTR